MLAHRAANTLDAVVGHRSAGSTRFGWAVVVDAARHPSPNAGLIEGAFAGALGVSLSGTNRDGDAVEDRGRLGGGPPPGPADIARAVRLRRWLGLATAGGLAVAALAGSALGP